MKAQTSPRLSSDSAQFSTSLSISFSGARCKLAVPRNETTGVLCRISWRFICHGTSLPREETRVTTPGGRAPTPRAERVRGSIGTRLSTRSLSTEWQTRTVDEKSRGRLSRRGDVVPTHSKRRKSRYSTRRYDR